MRVFQIRSEGSTPFSRIARAFGRSARWLSLRLPEARDGAGKLSLTQRANSPHTQARVAKRQGDDLQSRSTSVRLRPRALFKATRASPDFAGDAARPDFAGGSRARGTPHRRPQFLLA